MELEYKRLPGEAEEKNEKYELSALLDADSFFYGLWTGGTQLYKAGSLEIDELKSDINKWLPFQIDNSKFGVYSPYFALVPSSEFSTDEMKLLLFHQCKILNPKSFLVRNDYLERFGLRLIYVVPKKQVKWVNKQFPSARMVHVITAFLSELPLAVDETCVNVLVLDQKIIVAVTRSEKLLLANSYTTRCGTDLLYFLSLCFDRLNLDHKTTRINLSGQIRPSSDDHTLLERYFSNLDYSKPAIGLKEDSDLMPHIYQSIYSISQCA